MPKFLFIYRTDGEQYEREPSPEEMQATMAEWDSWMQQVGESMVDGGDGLLPDGRMVQSDGSVTDGAFIESKELIGGFSIVQADNYEQAAEYAKTCPVVREGGNVEVRQLAGYSDFHTEE